MSSKRSPIGITLGQDVFYSGGFVTGEVVVQLGEPTLIKGIRLIAEGKAWASCSNGDTSMIVQETYMKLNTFLLGTENQQPNIELPAGRHSYPFQLLLPAECPSSLSGKHGSVGYYLRAEVLRQTSHWKAQVPYTVVRIVDLNNYPAAREPVEQTDTTRVDHHCLMSSGPITATLKLARTGYLPGDQMLVTVSIDNQSHVTVTPKLQLVQNTYCFANKKQTYRSKVIAIEHACARAEAGTRYNKQRQILVPDLIAPLLGCSLMEVKHTLRLKVASIRLKIPLLIGNVPLRNVDRGIGPVRNVDQGVHVDRGVPMYVRPLANGRPAMASVTG